MIIMLYIVINTCALPLARCYELLPLHLSRTNATLDIILLHSVCRLPMLVSLTLNVNLMLFVIPSLRKNNMGII